MIYSSNPSIYTLPLLRVLFLFVLPLFAYFVGEFRISNFLLWQSAYTELFFVDKFWPDFTHAGNEI